MPLVLCVAGLIGIAVPPPIILPVRVNGLGPGAATVPRSWRLTLSGVALAVVLATKYIEDTTYDDPVGMVKDWAKEPALVIVSPTDAKFAFGLFGVSGAPAS
jgi:hypothetical protein